MFKILITFILLILSACSSNKYSAPENAEDLIGTKPTVILTRLDNGTQLSLSQYTGRPRVLLFWGTCCRGSKHAIKEMQEYITDTLPSVLKEARRKKYGRKIDRPVFMAANIDKTEQLDHVKEFINEFELYSIEQMFSGNDIYDEAYTNLLGERLPSFYVFNRQGKLIQVTTDMDDVADTLAEILN